MSELPGQSATLLVPEGALQLNVSGLEIVAACDGVRTFGEIVRMLQQKYQSGDRERIEQETADVLERLHARRVIDF